MLRRAFAIVAAVAAALVLSGCFVVSKNLPGGREVRDDRLVGTWRGVEGDDNRDSGAFLHFQKVDERRPLQLVWVEDKGYQVYEVHTMAYGAKQVFAAKLIAPPQSAKEMPTDAYFIGFYEFKSAGELSFTLLDNEKIGELIKKGKLKGVPPKGKYDMTTLTSSPSELAAFLASRDADAARTPDPARLRRVTAPQN